MKKIPIIKHHLITVSKSFFWFTVGAVLGLFFTISFIFILFQRIFGSTIFPGVYINNVNFGGKTRQDVIAYFNARNNAISNTTFTFISGDQIATVSAQKLEIGYNSQLLADQAYSIGRSQYLLSDIVLVFNAYLNGVFLNPSYAYSDQALQTTIAPIGQTVNIDPIDALFTFQNNKVIAFRPSSNGQTVDIDSLKQIISAKIPLIIFGQKSQSIVIPIPIKQLKPHVATGDANNLGIQELIGTGTSLFQHSAPERIFNVTLAATRMNGVLVAPNQVFSFDQALGDVSSFTGYKQAYIIQNGHTVLGDGGGVCQVSTTFFRALLNAGLPIVERHGHDYRVGYYEEDSPPGFDATVYVPSVDLKFRNDTGHYILIQSIIDPNTLRLTFNLYGTSDGRQVTISQPTITDQTAAPPPLYIDDPTLPSGVIKQTDFAANGARVSFTRVVTRDGKELYNDTYVTNYQPWQAVYVRGTGQ